MSSDRRWNRLDTYTAQCSDKPVATGAFDAFRLYCGRRTRLATAGFVASLTFVVLLFTRPPFVCRRQPESEALLGDAAIPTRLCGGRILAWTAVVFVIMLLGPDVAGG